MRSPKPQTIYKAYAGIIKNRIADGIDERIWKLQFGFRGKKSTAQAMFICRRLQDIAERGNEPMTMIFLDWQKAFLQSATRRSMLLLHKTCMNSISDSDWGVGA